MLGFLSVSTGGGMRDHPTGSFNPVLGFLSVSTASSIANRSWCFWFQSRAGFSECLDLSVYRDTTNAELFQSRAGFSECLDLAPLIGIWW